MGALDGVRVLDLSILVQGPQAAQMLRDMGAEVLKVELPAVGDMARWIPVGENDRRSAYFIACNRGKRSMTLDLRCAAGADVLRRLVESADVLISNFQPGTLERWNLGWDQLREVNPRLIYAAGSVLGASGPECEQEGSDLVGQAWGGLISTTGNDDGEPSPVGAVIADHIGSLNLVVGILAAVVHREQSGMGQRLDVSLLGGQIWAQASEYTHYLLSGELPGRANRGNPMIRALYGLVPTSDGWICLAGVVPASWPTFCDAIERPDLIDDERFTRFVENPADLASLRRTIDSVFLTRTSAEWAKRLKAAGQRFAPVHDYRDVVAHPQPWANGYFARRTDPSGCDVDVIGFPIAFSETPADVSAFAPELGMHTEEVLLEHGYSWDEIALLRETGAV